MALARRAHDHGDDSSGLEWLCSLLIALAWAAMVALAASGRMTPPGLALPAASPAAPDDWAEALELYIVDVQLVAAGWPSS